MRAAEDGQNGEHGIVEETGCGDCGEEFAEASVLSGLAGREAEQGVAAALCGAVLPACRGVSEAPARAGGANKRSAAGIDSGEPGGGGEFGGGAYKAVAGLCGCGRDGRGWRGARAWRPEDA